MKNNSLKEISVSIILVALSVFLLNPFDFYMPDMLVMSLLALALIVFGFFSSFIIREEEGDEREMAHRTTAGRVAFLVGSGVTIAALFFQSLSHSVDPWLVVILSSMVVAKMFTRFYSDRNF